MLRVLHHNKKKGKILVIAKCPLGGKITPSQEPLAYGEKGDYKKVAYKEGYRNCCLKCHLTQGVSLQKVTS